ATPYWSVIVFSVIGFLFSIGSSFSKLAVLASSSLLVIYLGVVFAAIKLRHVKKDESFTLPGGLTVPLLAMAVTLWFLYNLQPDEQISVVIFLVAASAVYGAGWLVKHKARK